ncbi:substrate-binding domain-containing protein [Erysipelothrix sp. D19-032]
MNREPTPQDLEIWPGKTTYVGADATQSGTIQGEMIAGLPNKGDINGDGKISYITLMGDPANVDAQQRTEYSIKGYEAKGGAVNLLAQPYQANWDSLRDKNSRRVRWSNSVKILKLSSQTTMEWQLVR